MHKKRIFILFWVIFSYALSGQPSAQTQNPDSAAEAGAVEIQGEAVISKQPPPVEINNHLLSVELVDAEFGPVLNEIALKSGFKAEIGADIYNKKLTTRFANMDIERGILRLLTLVKEKNYLIHYGSNGELSAIYVYGGASAPTVVNARPQTPAVRPQVQRPAKILPAVTPVPPPAAPPVARTPAAVQKNPPQGLRRLLSPLRERQQESRKAAAPPAPPQPQPDAAPKENIEEEEIMEEHVDEVPYVPSPRSPAYIPPRAQ